MTHEERERLLRLQSHEMHEAVDTTPGIQEIDRPIKEARKVDEDGKPYRLLWIGWQCVYVYDDRIKTHLGTMYEEGDINRAIALLQRARQIMGGQ